MKWGVTIVWVGDALKQWSQSSRIVTDEQKCVGTVTDEQKCVGKVTIASSKYCDVGTVTITCGCGWRLDEFGVVSVAPFP